MSRILLSAAAAVLLVLTVSKTQAGDTWTYPVVINEPALVAPTAENVKSTRGTYEALDPSEVTKPWHVCVNMSNMGDDYYVAMNFGAVEEAKRLDIQMTMTSAGGYAHLDKQISQVEDCVAQGAHAVLIMAISPTGLNDAIKEARKNGVVVIDLANGIDSPDINARTKASYYDIGRTLAGYLVKRHPKGSGETEVFWLPGPAGGGWSEDLNRGVKDVLGEMESDIMVVATQYGDTHKDAQLKLVEDGLVTYPNLKYIVGSSQGAEVAMQLLREQGREKDVHLVTSWITPYMDQVIREGKVLASVTDSVVIQTRMAIDQAVRILEGKPYIKDTGPEILMIDPDTINTYDKNTSMAPKGYKPIFRVDPATN